MTIYAVLLYRVMIRKEGKEKMQKYLLSIQVDVPQGSEDAHLQPGH